MPTPTSRPSRSTAAEACAWSIRIDMIGGSSLESGTCLGSRNSLVWRFAMWVRNVWTVWGSAFSRRGEVSSQPVEPFDELENVATSRDLDRGHGGRHDVGDLLAAEQRGTLGDFREGPGVDHDHVILAALADEDALRLVGDGLAHIQDQASFGIDGPGCQLDGDLRRGQAEWSEVLDIVGHVALGEVHHAERRECRQSDSRSWGRWRGRPAAP